jgi:hypothetical protein
VNADLFYLLALQQTCKDVNGVVAPSVPLSRVMPLHTNSVPNLRLANPLGGLGAAKTR